MSEFTEAEAIANLALSAVEPAEVAPGTIVTHVAPVGATITTLDHEKYDDRPRRRRGTVTTLDADSFSRLVTDLGPENGRSAIYGDVQALTVCAVLNDDQGEANDNRAAGWRDHRVLLPVVRTPAWQRWLARDGKIEGQAVFAQHLEENLADITHPDGADLLELAQSFEASQSVQFRSAARLKDGARQFTYVETIDARAGKEGTITVPDSFTLSIAPFEGADPAEITARLRYRLSGGQLVIGYELHQPKDVERAAFDVVLDKIGKATSIAPYRAQAPSATS